jgi:hypothetical protein
LRKDYSMTSRSQRPSRRAAEQRHELAPPNMDRHQASSGVMPTQLENDTTL